MLSHDNIQVALKEDEGKYLIDDELAKQALSSMVGKIKTFKDDLSDFVSPVVELLGKDGKVVGKLEIDFKSLVFFEVDNHKAELLDTIKNVPTFISLNLSHRPDISLDLPDKNEITINKISTAFISKTKGQDLPITDLPGKVEKGEDVELDVKGTKFNEAAIKLRQDKQAQELEEIRARAAKFNEAAIKLRKDQQAQELEEIRARAEKFNKAAIKLRKDQQEQELKELTSRADKNKTKEVLEKHFEDRSVASTKDFKEVEKKSSGLAQGYVAERQTDNHKFMLKHAFKLDADTKDENKKKKNQNLQDRVDFVSEYLTGNIYRRLLFDRAPIIELTTEGDELAATKLGTPLTADEKQKSIYLRSKFLDEFQTLKSFSENEDPSAYITVSSPKLSQLEGFEKVMAASLMMGETDFHSENIGVVKKTAEDGKKHFVAVKIDHGRSTLDTFSNESQFRSAMLDQFQELEYIDSSGQATISFRAKEFKESLDEMLKISENEITNIVENRVALLKKSGFDFHNIDFGYFKDLEEVKATANNDKEVVALYVTKLKEQLRVMKDLSATLDIIVKSDAPENIKNGGWVSSLGNQDPIVWALDNGYKIEGKEPLNWAIENNRLVEGKEAQIWLRDSLNGLSTQLGIPPHQLVLSSTDSGKSIHKIGIDNMKEISAVLSANSGSIIELVNKEGELLGNVKYVKGQIICEPAIGQKIIIHPEIAEFIEVVGAREHTLGESRSSKQVRTTARLSDEKTFVPSYLTMFSEREGEYKIASHDLINLDKYLTKEGSKIDLHDVVNDKVIGKVELINGKYVCTPISGNIVTVDPNIKDRVQIVGSVSQEVKGGIDLSNDVSLPIFELVSESMVDFPLTREHLNKIERIMNSKGIDKISLIDSNFPENSLGVLARKDGKFYCKPDIATEIILDAEISELVEIVKEPSKRVSKDVGMAHVRTSSPSVSLEGKQIPEVKLSLKDEDGKFYYRIDSKEMMKIAGILKDQSGSEIKLVDNVTDSLVGNVKVINGKIVCNPVARNNIVANPEIAEFIEVAGAREHALGESRSSKQVRTTARLSDEKTFVPSYLTMFSEREGEYKIASHDLINLDKYLTKEGSKIDLHDVVNDKVIGKVELKNGKYVCTPISGNVITVDPSNKDRFQIVEAVGEEVRGEIDLSSGPSLPKYSLSSADLMNYHLSREQLEAIEAQMNSQKSEKIALVDSGMTDLEIGVLVRKDGKFYCKPDASTEIIVDAKISELVEIVKEPSKRVSKDVGMAHVRTSSPSVPLAEKQTSRLSDGLPLLPIFVLPSESLTDYPLTGEQLRAIEGIMDKQKINKISLVESVVNMQIGTLERNDGKFYFRPAELSVIHPDAEAAKLVEIVQATHQSLDTQSKASPIMAESLDIVDGKLAIKLVKDRTALTISQRDINVLMEDFNKEIDKYKAQEIQLIDPDSKKVIGNLTPKVISSPDGNENIKFECNFVSEITFHLAPELGEVFEIQMAGKKVENEHVLTLKSAPVKKATEIKIGIKDNSLNISPEVVSYIGQEVIKRIKAGEDPRSIEVNLIRQDGSNIGRVSVAESYLTALGKSDADLSKYLVNNPSSIKYSFNLEKGSKIEVNFNRNQKDSTVNRFEGVAIEQKVGLPLRFDIGKDGKNEILITKDVVEKNAIEQIRKELLRTQFDPASIQIELVEVKTEAIERGAVKAMFRIDEKYLNTLLEKNYSHQELRKVLLADIDKYIEGKPTALKFSVTPLEENLVVYEAKDLAGAKTVVKDTLSKVAAHSKAEAFLKSLSDRDRGIGVIQVDEKGYNKEVLEKIKDEINRKTKAGEKADNSSIQFKYQNQYYSFTVSDLVIGKGSEPEFRLHPINQASKEFASAMNFPEDIFSKGIAAVGKDTTIKYSTEDFVKAMREIHKKIHSDPNITIEELRIKIGGKFKASLSTSSLLYLKDSQNFEDIDLSKVKLNSNLVIKQEEINGEIKVKVQGLNIEMDALLRQNFYGLEQKQGKEQKDFGKSGKLMKASDGSEWEYLKPKSGGKNDPGEFGGIYQNEEGLRALIKKDKPEKNIAEFLASKMHRVTEPDTHAEVRFAHTGKRGESPYVASIFLENYAGDLYVDAFSKVKGEVPDSRPRMQGSKNVLTKLKTALTGKESNTVLENAFETQKYTNFGGAVAPRLLTNDLDMHPGNLGVVRDPYGVMKPKLVSIDFGGANKSLAEKIHPHSHLRHPVGFGPTNHFREYRRIHKITPEFVAACDRVRDADYKKPIKEAFDEIKEYNNAEAIRKFGQRMGVPKSELRKAKDDKDKLINVIKEHYEGVMLARQNDLSKFSAQIKTDLCIQQGEDGKWKIDAYKDVDGREVSFEDVVRQHKAYFQAVVDGKEKLKFRERAHIDEHKNLSKLVIVEVKNILEREKVAAAELMKMEKRSLSSVQPEVKAITPNDKGLKNIIDIRLPKDNIINEAAMWEIIKGVQIAAREGEDPGKIRVRLNGNDRLVYDVIAIDAKFLREADSTSLNKDNFYKREEFQKQQFLQIAPVTEEAKSIKPYTMFTKFMSAELVAQAILKPDIGKQKFSDVKEDLHQNIHKQKDPSTSIIADVKAVTPSDNLDQQKVVEIEFFHDGPEVKLIIKNSLMAMVAQRVQKEIQQGVNPQDIRIKFLHKSEFGNTNYEFGIIAIDEKFMKEATSRQVTNFTGLPAYKEIPFIQIAPMTENAKEKMDVVGDIRPYVNKNIASEALKHADKLTSSSIAVVEEQNSVPIQPKVESNVSKKIPEIEIEGNKIDENVMKQLLRRFQDNRVYKDYQIRLIGKDGDDNQISVVVQLNTVGRHHLEDGKEEIGLYYNALKTSEGKPLKDTGFEIGIEKAIMNPRSKAEPSKNVSSLNYNISIDERKLDIEIQRVKDKCSKEDIKFIGIPDSANIRDNKLDSAIMESAIVKLIRQNQADAQVSVIGVRTKNGGDKEVVDVKFELNEKGKKLLRKGNQDPKAYVNAIKLSKSEELEKFEVEEEVKKYLNEPEKKKGLWETIKDFVAGSKASKAEEVKPKAKNTLTVSEDTTTHALTEELSSKHSDKNKPDRFAAKIDKKDSAKARLEKERHARKNDTRTH